MSWYVCQIGAREHYAIPRALKQVGVLAGLITDFWVPPSFALSRLPKSQRLRERYHQDLAGSQIHAPNKRMLVHEVFRRLKRKALWPGIISHNEEFQRRAIRILSAEESQWKQSSPPTLFSYSYAARNLFKWAKDRGWKTVLGQIDPGPEEERIVTKEHRRYPALPSSWEPAPETYWESWREEVHLSDRIIVNSEWSKRCLHKQGITTKNIEVIPLVYNEKDRQEINLNKPQKTISYTEKRKFKLLFLGQVNLRKGIVRLLDSMRLLLDEPVELTIAGPTDINFTVWEDLPNIRCIGPIPRSQVGLMYEQADCFILPTLSDGYALTQLEALSYGVPVIASDRCGEAVSHGINGWVLSRIDSQSIAAAIKNAMNNPITAVKAPLFSFNDLAESLQKNSK